MLTSFSDKMDRAETLRESANPLLVLW